MSKKTEKLPTLKDSKKSFPSTQIKIHDIAKLIVEKGYGRMACVKYAMDTWNLSEAQADKYYYGAISYLKPDNPEEIRDALIARNFGVLETMLQRALDTNDLSTANQIINTMNKMLSVGDNKKVQLETKDEKIIVTFGD